MRPTQQGLADWHTLATSPDPERLARLVAEGAVFHSPVVHTPQEGRTLVVAYLSAAAATLGQGQFRYLREILDGPHAMLEFTCILDDIQVNGVDIITFDDAGKIADFKVMIRPIKAVNKVWEMMAAQLEKASAS
ncbi:nuclear transport factor 2 family protein [Citromicrobium bathyomarinum]|uniref:nuclear transport factor 2 family protein n=1 Tax=Citromicrobium bathyomarinum TaxID=72174 RepID=UPI00315B0859